MIKTVNLQKVYRTEEVETTALRNVNLEISEGEFVAVMGPLGLRQIHASERAGAVG